MRVTYREGGLVEVHRIRGNRAGVSGRMHLTFRWCAPADNIFQICTQIICIQCNWTRCYICVCARWDGNSGDFCCHRCRATSITVANYLQTTRTVPNDIGPGRVCIYMADTKNPLKTTCIRHFRCIYSGRIVYM